jgi:hypothetical protein
MSKRIENYEKIIEGVCDADRVFFEEHPEIDCFVRPLIPGEFPIKLSQFYNRVLVTKINGDIRTRQPFCALED